MRKLSSWNWKRGGCTLYPGVCSMNSLTADTAHMLEREWICLRFFNADFNVSRVVDFRIEGNVLAGEVDVVVERTITC